MPRTVGVMLDFGRPQRLTCVMPIGNIKSRLWVDLAVGALGAARDSQDDHEIRAVVDEVDDPKVADAEAPEAGVGELDDAGRARIDRQGQDRSADPRGVTGREPSKLALRGGGEFDAASALAHASSGS